ncbi:MAG: trimeric autotransporter adhesin, partial [Candidatus Woesearchaeota archaeon]|nr:trimeric autotransporter adhesin [Candidatus Woesearchaeota archaeon]
MISRMNLKRIWIILLVFFMLPVGLAVNIELSDQGTGAKQAGSLVNNGDLTVEIWNAATAGTLIWSETFVDAIKDGSWNVMLGQNASNPLSLEYGQKYWKDYKINSEDIDFLDNSGNTIERLEFYSPLGYINSKTLFNFSMINPCAEGYAIRSINTDGSVVCEQISAGAVASGWTDSGAVVELVTSTDSINANTLYVDNTNGRVGIGTTSPSYNLHVNGNFYANTVNTGIGNTEVYLMNQNVRTTDAVTFATVNTGQGANELYAMNQNVRTTDSPTFSNVYIADNMIHSGDTNTYIGFPAADTIRMVTAGTERVRILSNGNVGIGTTSPGAKLDVAGDVRLTGTYGATLSAGKYPFKGYWAYSDDGTGYGPAFIHTNTATGNTYPTLFLQTSGDGAVLRVDSAIGVGDMTLTSLGSMPSVTTRIYIGGSSGENSYFNTGGNVGIGTISPSYKLHVNGSFFADNVDTGIGATEVYLMNQNVRTTDAVTFATIDTGSGAKELGDASVTDGDTNSIPTNDQVYDFVASYVGSGGSGDIYVNEAGDTMTGNLDMNGNKIINVNKLHATSMGI